MMPLGFLAASRHAPTTTFVDNFDRPDSNDLGSSWSDALGSNGLMIQNQALHIGAGTGVGTHLIVAGTFSPDQYIEVDVGSATWDQEARSANLLLRGATDRSGYELQLFHFPSFFNLYSFSGSTDTEINDQAVPEITALIFSGEAPDMPYRVRFQVVGNRLTAWVGGFLLLDVTDNTHTSGMPGVGIYLADMYVGNVEAGSL